MTCLERLLGRPPKICILSFSTIPDDPRVRRQGDAFFEAGWSVVAIGLPGWRSAPPAWPVYAYNEPIVTSTAGRDPCADTSSTSEERVPAAVSTSPVDSVPCLAAPSANGIAGRGQEYLASTDKSRFERAKEAFKRVAPSPVFGLAKRTYAHGLRARARIRIAYYTLRHYVLFRPKQIVLQRYSMAQEQFQVLRLTIDPRRGAEIYLQRYEIRRFLETASGFDADIFLANDWHMLPVAMALAERQGAKFCYDTHEYALEEYKYRLYFRLFLRPLARAIEGRGLREALVASTVSSGIAKELEREYRLGRPVFVIRNMPYRQDVLRRPVGSQIVVLYHGLVVQDRGLEECVRSVAFLRPEFRLLFRGPGTADYIDRLKAIARECGVADRVEFAQPVKMTDLIRAAASADIGISTPPRTSKHNLYALPNKFFEYVQAGLALCVCDIPDYAKLVREYDLGVLIKEVTPAAIAEALNSFTRESLNEYKKRSIEAAGVLNWETERNRLIDSYTKALESSLALKETALCSQSARAA
jgi:glycosyltransferase involved in cell wall biosynthesis